MPWGLVRYQQEGDDHFITFSCYHREPYLNTPSARDTFLDSLELTRQRYQFDVLGYVVMPEHVHLLLGEPLDREIPLANALHALKLSVAKRLPQSPFWRAATTTSTFIPATNASKNSSTCTAIRSSAS